MQQQIAHIFRYAEENSDNPAWQSVDCLYSRCAAVDGGRVGICKAGREQDRDPRLTGGQQHALLQ